MLTKVKIRQCVYSAISLSREVMLKVGDELPSANLNEALGLRIVPPQLRTKL